jgi:recombination protein RecA
MERTRHQSLSVQMKKKVSEVKEKEDVLDGDFGKCISTGSTLLDLAISGGRIRGGGLPGGILIEIFGPSGSGKTVLLSEIAGAVQRQGGEIMFHDPEARLNKQFAKLFGLELAEKDHYHPNKVTEVFKAVRAWEPENTKIIHGIFADSLAALSTQLEMEEEDGDKMGMRRAKEFSEELRKTCRILTQKKYLMVCSNQIRQNMDAGQYGQKFITPGGKAMEFYASLRLRTSIEKKHKIEKTFAGKKVERIIGVRAMVEVTKSSIWKPFHTAPVTIIFDYGIDNLKDSLQFIKDYSKYNVYTLEEKSLSNDIEKAVKIIEEDELELSLKNEVINLWENIESKFITNRIEKRRV